jgi:hypothetical protein
MLFLFMALIFSAQAQDCFLCPPLKDWRWFLPQAPFSEWPVEFVKMNKEEYPRNENASYCLRPTEMVDTIVIHHSETPSTETAMNINRFHLNRGTPEDPWYMIAYSYVINTPYPGASTPSPKVTEGRPMEIVGAHAGSNAFVPMNEEQQKMWDEGKITCGKTGGEFKVDMNLLRDGRIKANVTTIGLVVIGNYAQFSRSNPNGYAANKPRIPTNQTLELVAKTSCQLQKRYPNIKTIKWHNFYQSTTCPGILKNYVAQINTIAKGLGCDFN